MISQTMQTLRVNATRAGRALRPWLPVLLMVAVILLATPAVAQAQGSTGMFAQITLWLGKAAVAVGGIMMIGGLLLILAGGWGVKEGRGGWAPMAVGLVITYIGYQVFSNSSGGMPSPTSIFG
jgi:hypothetical protein